MGVPPSGTPAHSGRRRFVRGPQDTAAGAVVIVIAALILHALSRISDVELLDILARAVPARLHLRHRRRRHCC